MDQDMVAWNSALETLKLKLLMFNRASVLCIGPCSTSYWTAERFQNEKSAAASIGVHHVLRLSAQGAEP